MKIRRRRERIAIVDTETTGTRPWAGDRAFMFCAGVDGTRKVWEHPVDPYTREVTYTWPDSEFKDLMEDARVIKVFHNAKFDVTMCRAAGIDVKGRIEDTMNMARIARSDELTCALKPLTKKYFGVSDDDQKDLQKAVQSLRGRAGRLGYNLADALEADYWLVQRAEEIMVEGAKFLKSCSTRMLEDAVTKARAMEKLCEKYCIIDVDRTEMLYHFYLQILQDLGTYHIYREEMDDVFPVVLAMEQRGMYCDMSKVQAGINMCEKIEEESKAELERLTWPGFNPNSSKQKIKYFIEECGLEPLRLTPAHNPQVDKVFFEHYADVCPAAKYLRLTEQGQKARSTYFENYLCMADEYWLLHPSLEQCGAKTLRFSCRDPNLQNVPKRGKPGDLMLEVRRPFGPRPGCVWFLGDYMQIEARIFAHVAQEKSMIESFLAGRDVYQDLTDTIVSITGIEATRNPVKSIFLGKLYGLGRQKMIYQLMAMDHNATEANADAVIQAFDEALPGVKGYMDECKGKAKVDGYIMNQYGQKMEVDPELCYRAVNYIIQPEAARLMKRAMVKCHRFLQECGYGYLCMTIHDELIFEFENGRKPLWVLKELNRLMADNGGCYCVPTPVEWCKVTGSWLDKVKCKWSLS